MLQSDALPIYSECQCHGLHRKCPACIAWDAAGKQPRRQSLAACVLIPAHEDIVLRVRAGERYTGIAAAYGVSIDVLMGYLKRTGAYAPRQLARRQEIRQLAPKIVRDHARGGRLIRELAIDYGVSRNAIRMILHRSKDDAQ